MPDNLRHAQYGDDGVQIDNPQMIWTPVGVDLSNGRTYQQNGVPAVGSRLQVFTNGPQIVDDATQGTTETTAFLVPIKAGWLGKNDGLMFFRHTTCTNSAAAKRMRARFGGTVLYNWDLTTHLYCQYLFTLRNQNSLSIQKAQANSTTALGPIGSVGEQTFNVDFSVDQALTFTFQFPVAGTGTNTIADTDIWVMKI